MKRPPASGFTLIEAAVVLSIISIVAALSMAALQGMKSRASFSSASGAIESAVRRARAESFGRGRSVAFVIDPVGKRWWTVEAALTGFVLNTFNPATPTGLIESGSLPESMSFGPAAGYGVALNAPFSGVPVVSGDSPALPFCSFCDTSSTNAKFGSIVFEPGGTTKFSAGPNAVGHQFTITGAADVGTRTRLIAVMAGTGLIEAFER